MGQRLTADKCTCLVVYYILPGDIDHSRVRRGLWNPPKSRRRALARSKAAEALVRQSLRRGRPSAKRTPADVVFGGAAGWRLCWCRPPPLLAPTAASVDADRRLGAPRNPEGGAPVPPPPLTLSVITGHVAGAFLGLLAGRPERSSRLPRRAARHQLPRVAAGCRARRDDISGRGGKRRRLPTPHFPDFSGPSGKAPSSAPPDRLPRAGAPFVARLSEHGR